MNDSDVKVVYGEYVAKGYKAKELALASHGYIANDVRDIKTSYIRLGFHLRESQKNLYYEDFGFISLADYADANFGLDKSALSRCMKVFERFSLRQGGVCKMFLDDRYKDYSYSQLCEMVSIDDGHLQKIKPSMTVKEIRELKRKVREESKNLDPIPEITQLSKLLAAKKKDGIGAVELEQVIQEGKVAMSQPPDPDGTDDVPDVKYQELDPAEKVATSQLPEPERKWNIEKEWSTLDESSRIKWVLEKYRENLALSLSARMFPDFVIYQKTLVVTARELYFQSLEGSAANPDPEPQLQENEPDHKQPDLPVLKNNEQRKIWLRSYKDWGLWYRDDHIGVDYYKYDFDNGARLIVEMYHRKATKYRDAHDEYYYHLLRRPDSEFERFPDSETVLLEFLKELQKKSEHKRR